MKLYDIRDDYLGLLALVDSGELTEDQIADTLEAINDEFDDKARNCLMLIKHVEGQAAMAKAEADRLKALADSYAKQAESVKEYLRFNMEAAGKDKLDLGIFKVTLRKPTLTAAVVNELEIPSTYFKVIPETRQLDKRALLAGLKDGSVSGAELREGKRSLLIK